MLLDGLQYITASHHWRFAYAAKCRFWLRLQCASSAQTSCFSASNFAVVVWEGLGKACAQATRKGTGCTSLSTYAVNTAW